MDRLLLIASTFCFLLGFAYTMFTLGAGRYRPSRWSLGVVGLGFLLQTGFLYLRGEALGRCPLTNLFEVLTFLSWSMVLFYLLIGPAYRLSLMGAFTSPLAFLIQTVALLIPGADHPPVLSTVHNPWLEMHAAFSVMAYGAFALACVAGGMYLAQERQLKTHQLHSMFFQLPPIRDLGVTNARLMLAGFGLLSVGLVAGFVMGNLEAHMVKIFWSCAVWLLYGVVLAAVFRHSLSGRRVAWLSVGAFGVVVGTLWSLKFISQPAPL